MTGPAAGAAVGEREPAPRRRATYRGDLRATLAASKHYLGPDTRGVVWTPCHAEYDVSGGSTTVIFRPVSKDELGDVYKAWENKK